MKHIRPSCFCEGDMPYQSLDPFVRRFLPGMHLLQNTQTHTKTHKRTHTHTHTQTHTCIYYIASVGPFGSHGEGPMVAYQQGP